MAVTLSGAALQLVEGLRRLRLPLSIPKTVYMASSKGLADRLEHRWPDHGFKRKLAMRNLGVDAGGGKRRATGTQDARVSEALRQSVRVVSLRKAGAKVD